MAKGYTGHRFGLARYSPDGMLDAGFSGDGRVTTQFTGTSWAVAWVTGLDVDSNGKIVAAGQATIDNLSKFALARYNSNGTLDASFSGDGKVTTDFAGSSGGWASSVAIDASGRIVAAGSATIADKEQFALARYNSNGTLDSSFSGDGMVTTTFSMNTGARANSVAIDASGKIVAGGWVADWVDIPT